MKSAVGRRYARALFALAKDQKELDNVAGQLAQLAALAEDESIGPVLHSPVLPAQRRVELVRLLARELRLSDLMMRFLQVLAAHNRLVYLAAVHDDFQQLLDAEFGRVRITIRSAQPLTPAQHQQLVATFARVTNKDVIPTSVVDPDLLGGVVVEAEGKVYDGSVRMRLERLAKELTGLSTP
jgi:F-type H+-transporting ATPase subunit delta